MQEFIKEWEKWIEQPQIITKRKNQRKKKNINQLQNMHETQEDRKQKQFQNQKSLFIRQKQKFVFFYIKNLQYFVTQYSNYEKAKLQSLKTAIKNFKLSQKKCVQQTQKYSLNCILKQFREQFVLLLKSLLSYNAKQLAEFDQTQTICTNIKKIDQNRKNPAYPILQDQQNNLNQQAQLQNNYYFRQNSSYRSSCAMILMIKSLMIMMIMLSIICDVDAGDFKSQKQIIFQHYNYSSYIVYDKFLLDSNISKVSQALDKSINKKPPNIQEVQDQIIRMMVIQRSWQACKNIQKLQLGLFIQLLKL